MLLQAIAAPVAVFTTFMEFVMFFPRCVRNLMNVFLRSLDALIVSAIGLTFVERTLMCKMPFLKIGGSQTIRLSLARSSGEDNTAPAGRRCPMNRYGCLLGCNGTSRNLEADASTRSQAVSNVCRNTPPFSMNLSIRKHASISVMKKLNLRIDMNWPFSA